MQTFMPYSDFSQVAKCLDRQRLGKQRLETWQIYLALTKEDYGWKRHPIVKMWKGYEQALLVYGIYICSEWISRGYKDTMFEKFNNEYNKLNPLKQQTIYPEWIYNEKLLLSHQSNLVRKFPEHYKKFFPNVPDNLEYVWVK